MIKKKNKIFKDILTLIVILLMIVGLMSIEKKTQSVNASQVQQQDTTVTKKQKVYDYKKASKNRQMEQKTHNEKLKEQLKSVKKDTIN